MKIQQINRYRAKSGWQITGASKNVTQVMEKEFTAMYTTIPTVTSDIPFILDAGYGKEKNDFYISHIIKGGADTLGRPTPFFTGFILGKKLLRYCTDNPEMFLRISDENFNHEYDAEQEKKKELPELESFQMDNLILDATAIRRKYKITDEEFEQLIYRIYEVFLDDSGKTMEFGFDGPKEEYVNLIREMVFLAYSVTPPSLRNRITFSNYQITGMINRMFTVIEADGCGQNTNIWFNLKTREFSESSGDKDEISLRTRHLSYLAYWTDEERKEALERVDENLKEIYKNPSVKSGESLQTALLAAFLAVPGVSERCINSLESLGKYMGKLLYMKADKTELIEQELAYLLECAKEKNFEIPDSYFKRCQNYYFSTQNGNYRDAFLDALSTRKASALKKPLKDAIKEPSSERVDEFIAKLILRLNEENYDVWTKDVVALLRERYLTTESSKLKDCYYEYVGQMNLSLLSREELKETIEESISQVRASREDDVKERAIGVLKSQVKNLDRNRIELSENTRKKLLKICVRSGLEYEEALFDAVKRYYQDIYLSKPVEEAVEYYKELRDNCPDMGTEVEQELRQETGKTEDEILDYYYVKYELSRKRIKDVDKLLNELENICNFPVYNKSWQALLEKYNESLNIRMSKHKNNNSELYEMYWKLKEELERLEKIRIPINKMKDSIEQYFWKYADIEGMSQKKFKYYSEKVSGDYNKKKEAIKKYWDDMDYFVFCVNSEHPLDENIVIALTTDQYIKNLDRRKENIRETIGTRRDTRDTELSLDALLLRYFDQKGGFSDTAFGKEFLEHLTLEQQAQIENSIVLRICDEDGAIFDAIKKGIKRQRKKEKKRNRRSPLKIIIPVLGLAFILTVGIVVAEVFIFSDRDDSKQGVKTGTTSAQTEDTSTDEKKGKKEEIAPEPPEVKAYAHWLSLNPQNLDDGSIQIKEEQKIEDVGFCVKDGKIYTVHGENLDEKAIATKGIYSNVLTDNKKGIVYCICIDETAQSNDKKIFSYPYKKDENELDKKNKKTFGEGEEIISFCLVGEDIIVLIKGKNNERNIMRVNLQGEEQEVKELGNLNDLLPEEATKIKDIVNYEGNLYGILDEEKSAKKILFLNEEDVSENDMDTKEQSELNNNNAEQKQQGASDNSVQEQQSVNSSSKQGESQGNSKTIIVEDYGDPYGTNLNPPGQ